MADQDFRINIVTLADLTGIKLTQEQLSALQTAAAAGNKDAIAALKKLSDAQKEASQTARQAQQEFVSGIRAAAGYGLIIGGSVAKAINDVANAQNKVTKELDKEFESLVRNVQQWNKLAQAAGNPSELAGVGEKALSQIDQIHAKFREANDDSRTLFQSMVDTAVAGFKNAFTFGGDPNAKGPFENIQDSQRESLQLAEEIARVQAGAAIEQGLQSQAKFDRLKGAGIDEAITKTTDHLKEAKRILDSLNPRDNLNSWIAQERIVERITKELQILQNLQKAAIQSGQPTTHAGVLQGQMNALGAAVPRGMQGTNLTPLEESQVRDNWIRTRGQLKDTFIQNESDARDKFQKDIRDRYEKGFPGATSPLPGGANQIETNQQILTALQRLLSLWQ